MREKGLTLLLFYRLGADAQRRRMVQSAGDDTILFVKMSSKDRAAMARRRAKSGASVTKPKERRRQFAMCVRNDQNPASLKLHQTYEVIPDGKATRNHMVRVVDELGEDYLYPENYFVAVKNSTR
jgi:hypothetical protein